MFAVGGLQLAPCENMPQPVEPRVGAYSRKLSELAQSYAKQIPTRGPTVPVVSGKL